MTHDAPRDPEAARFYDEVYHASPPTVSMRHWRLLAARLGIAAGQTLLDVGCGGGDWLATAAGLGARVSGLDLSPRAVARCRERLPEAGIQEGSAERLPFPDAHFDWVTCLGTLEHVADPGAAVREIVRVTAPGGRVLLLVPNAGFLPRRWGLFGGTAQRAVREEVLSLDGWRSLFAAGGLDLRDRWPDTHLASRAWILRPPGWWVPARFVLAVAMMGWPLAWQYQVYHLCGVRPAAQGQ